MGNIPVGRTNISFARACIEETSLFLKAFDKSSSLFLNDDINLSKRSSKCFEKIILQKEYSEPLLEQYVYIWTFDRGCTIFSTGDDRFCTLREDVVLLDASVSYLMLVIYHKSNKEFLMDSYNQNYPETNYNQFMHLFYKEYFSKVTHCQRGIEPIFSTQNQIYYQKLLKNKLESKNLCSFAEVYSFIGCSSCPSTCKRLTSCRKLLIDTIHCLFQSHELLQAVDMPTVINRACKAKTCLLVSRKVLGCIEKIDLNGNDTLLTDTSSSKNEKVPDLVEYTMFQTVSQEEPRVLYSSEKLTISPRCLYRAILAISPTVAALGVSPRGVRQVSHKLLPKTIDSWNNKQTCFNRIEYSNNLSNQVPKYVVQNSDGFDTFNKFSSFNENTSLDVPQRLSNAGVEKNQRFDYSQNSSCRSDSHTIFSGSHCYKESLEITQNQVPDISDRETNRASTCSYSSIYSDDTEICSSRTVSETKSIDSYSEKRCSQRNSLGLDFASSKKSKNEFRESNCAKGIPKLLLKNISYSPQSINSKNVNLPSLVEIKDRKKEQQVNCLCNSASQSSHKKISSDELITDKLCNVVPSCKVPNLDLSTRVKREHEWHIVSGLRLKRISIDQTSSRSSGKILNTNAINAKQKSSDTIIKMFCTNFLKTREDNILQSDVVTQSEDQYNCESKATLLDRYRNVCSEIIPGARIFLSGVTVAQNYNLMKKMKITHILNVGGETLCNTFHNDFHYLIILLHDNRDASEEFSAMLFPLLDYVHSCLQDPCNSILIHCQEGVSRSASLVVAYIMWIARIRFRVALDVVRLARLCCNPNTGFTFALLCFEKLLFKSIRTEKLFYRHVQSLCSSKLSGDSRQYVLKCGKVRSNDQPALPKFVLASSCPKVSVSQTHQRRLYLLKQHDLFLPIVLALGVSTFNSLTAAWVPSLSNGLDPRFCYILRNDYHFYLWKGKESVHQELMEKFFLNEFIEPIIFFESANECEEWTYSILENDREPNGFWDLLCDKPNEKHEFHVEERSIINRHKNLDNLNEIILRCQELFNFEEYRLRMENCNFRKNFLETIMKNKPYQNVTSHSPDFHKSQSTPIHIRLPSHVLKKKLSIQCDLKKPCNSPYQQKAGVVKIPHLNNSSNVQNQLHNITSFHKKQSFVKSNRKNSENMFHRDELNKNTFYKEWNSEKSGISITDFSDSSSKDLSLSKVDEKKSIESFIKHSSFEKKEPLMKDQLVEDWKSDVTVSSKISSNPISSNDKNHKGENNVILNNTEKHAVNRTCSTSSHKSKKSFNNCRRSKSSNTMSSNEESEGAYSEEANEFLYENENSAFSDVSVVRFIEAGVELIPGVPYLYIYPRLEEPIELLDDYDLCTFDFCIIVQYGVTSVKKLMLLHKENNVSGQDNKESDNLNNGNNFDTNVNDSLNAIDDCALSLHISLENSSEHTIAESVVVSVEFPESLVPDRNSLDHSCIKSDESPYLQSTNSIPINNKKTLDLAKLKLPLLSTLSNKTSVSSHDKHHNFNSVPATLPFKKDLKMDSNCESLSKYSAMSESFSTTVWVWRGIKWIEEKSKFFCEKDILCKFKQLHCLDQDDSVQIYYETEGMESNKFETLVWLS